METLKKYWGVLVLFLSSIAAIAFYFLKSRPSPKNSDSEEMVNKLFNEEKAKLVEEKSQLEQEKKDVDSKDATDVEIEKKYN